MIYRFSRASILSLISLPKANPPRPLLATTRWQGTMARKGLVAISSASVTGTVGRPASRSAFAAAARRSRASLPGSTDRAKRMLASVYSWPEQIRVSAGMSRNCARLAHIWPAVPSNRRPQPQAIRLSAVKAARLARYMERLAREHPGSLIHLIGYSTGAYVAFEAVRRLAPEVPVGRVIALHGTVSPDYPLEAVAGRALGIVNVYGRLDCLINGLAPLLFGTNDRVHTLACGMVGLRCSAVNVEQRAWRLRDARLGYLGGHFTAVSGAWLRRYIVPRLV
mgnify:CR=1 FL=1